jgi:hypothetical protein
MLLIFIVVIPKILKKVREKDDELFNEIYGDKISSDLNVMLDLLKK